MRVGVSMAQTDSHGNLRSMMLNRLDLAVYRASCSREAHAHSVYHRTSQRVFEWLRVALYSAVVERTASVLRSKRTQGDHKCNQAV